jgi:hypothetical protein
VFGRSLDWRFIAVCRRLFPDGRQSGSSPKVSVQLFAKDSADRFKPDAGLPRQGGHGGDLTKATLVLDALK